MTEVVLEVNSIKKHYQISISEKLLVLNNINIKLHRGEIISIVGESGTGKSTLLHIMSGIDKPTTGKVKIIDDIITDSSMADKDIARIRNQHIGIIFQSYNLLPDLTALENVMLPVLLKDKNKGLAREKARDILSALQLTQKINHLPSMLSSGQKQRVAIGRAIVNNPDIVLADEPTGSLDSVTSQSVQSLLLSLPHEYYCGMIIVSHDRSLAEKAHQVYELNSGILSAENSL